MSTLDNLKKSARRWLHALRTDDAAARARLERAWPGAPRVPVLRDVQHALARERGHGSWSELGRALVAAERLRVSAPDVEQYDRLARDVSVAYRDGDPGALDRLAELTGRTLSHADVRAAIDAIVSGLPDAERPPAGLTVTYVRDFIARRAGFSAWDALVDAMWLDRLPSAPGSRVGDGVPPDASSVITTMLQPVELRPTLPIELQEGLVATTAQVWRMLVAAHAGDVDGIEALLAEEPGLARCEYNYLPPLHLAVREGHVDSVRCLLEHDAFDPEYLTYPYKETLAMLAVDRGDEAIGASLRESARRPRAQPAGAPIHGAGTISHPSNEIRERFEQLVAANALAAVEAMLHTDPGLVHDDPGGEGVLSQPANRRQWKMLELLLRHGARVPEMAKWGRAYYFRHHDVAAFLLERGMNPNHMNWQRTTLLHDMAFEGDVRKARLLLDHGATIDVVDDEFRSTPLGLAARWGRRDLVRLLLERGTDVNLAGADWARPLAWAEKRGHREIAEELRAAGAR